MPMRARLQTSDIAVYCVVPVFLAGLLLLEAAEMLILV